MNVYLTGITGTLGTELARLHHERGDRVWGSCLSENGAVVWDVCNPGVAVRVMDSCASRIVDHLREIQKSGHAIERVYHLAAVKHIDRAERDPEHAAQQNIEVTRAVARACQERAIPLVFADTDKSCFPGSVYGASKLIASRIVLQRGGTCVRMGNLIGSSGSVFCRWAELARAGKPIPLTDPDMTRLFLTIGEAARLMADVAPDCPGRIVVPGMRSCRLGDVVEWFGTPLVIGRRPGERQHEWLIGPGELASLQPAGHWLVGGGEEHERGLGSDLTDQWDLYELRDHIQTAVGKWR